MDKLEKKIIELIELIRVSFENVKLENGISWLEAYEISSYGNLERKKLARNRDKKNDWTNIPSVLIENLKYQDTLSFLDYTGLKYYLPVCMIYNLKNYTKSESLIINSIIYKLTEKKTAKELQIILNKKQKECIVKFLSLCLEIGDNYFDLHKVETRTKKYWLENISYNK